MFRIWMIVIVATVWTSVAAGEAPAPGSFILYPERIVLKDGGFHEAERGVLFAPANRSNPDGGVVTVEVYRFKATEKADPNTPPLFTLPGGPASTVWPGR